MPPPTAASDPERRDYLLLAAGLGRLLALCSPRGAEREFGSALQAYRGLRVQVRRGGALQLPAQVLNDLSHEIAQHADRATREAALRCLLRQRARRATASGQVRFA